MITRDNVSLKVNAVIYLRVMDPNNAIIEVENFLFSTSQLAQTTLRSVCGQVLRNVLERVYYIPILSPPPPPGEGNFKDAIHPRPSGRGILA